MIHQTALGHLRNINPICLPLTYIVTASSIWLRKKLCVDVLNCVKQHGCIPFQYITCLRKSHRFERDPPNLVLTAIQHKTTQPSTEPRALGLFYPDSTGVPRNYIVLKERQIPTVHMESSNTAKVSTIRYRSTKPRLSTYAQSTHLVPQDRFGSELLPLISAG